MVISFSSGTKSELTSIIIIILSPLFVRHQLIYSLFAYQKNSNGTLCTEFHNVLYKQSYDVWLREVFHINQLQGIDWYILCLFSTIRIIIINHDHSHNHWAKIYLCTEFHILGYEHYALYSQDFTTNLNQLSLESF